MAENQDLLLFRLIQKGNKEAFEKFFRSYYEAVSRFVFRYVKDADTAEEIAQDLFIHLWENAPRLQIKTSLKAYVFMSAKNFALNYIKKNKIREKYHGEAQSLEHEEMVIIDEGHSSKFTQLLKQALTTLPEKCREIFELSKYEGLSYEEIADYLSISKKTVENQIGIALRKIREWMQPYVNELYE